MANESVYSNITNRPVKQVESKSAHGDTINLLTQISDHEHTETRNTNSQTDSQLSYIKTTNGMYDFDLRSTESGSVFSKNDTTVYGDKAYYEGNTPRLKCPMQCQGHLIRLWKRDYPDIITQSV